MTNQESGLVEKLLHEASMLGLQLFEESWSLSYSLLAKALKLVGSQLNRIDLVTFLINPPCLIGQAVTTGKRAHYIKRVEKLGWPLDHEHDVIGSWGAATFIITGSRPTGQYLLMFDEKDDFTLAKYENLNVSYSVRQGTMPKGLTITNPSFDRIRKVLRRLSNMDE